MTRTKEAAIATALMLGLFAFIMLVGYPVRHGHPVWQDICWEECLPRTALNGASK